MRGSEASHVETRASGTRATAERAIWICRHGHREDQADERYRERGDRPFDPPLSQRGRQQAAELGQRLADEGIAAVFASPFRRTTETACIVAASLGLRVKLEPGLGEWLRDVWFDAAPQPLWLKAHELAATYEQVDAAHEPLPIEPAWPEAHESMLARTAETARTLTERYEGNLLLVGHGASVAGASRGLMRACGPVGVTTPLCCLVKIACQRGIWGIEMNGSDVSHLRDTDDLYWC
ncbi:MAG: histidine phosphatase family protein [Phycisphaeraceae bacterium]|nr:histidine phosphatase family protein [Phycisphaeraceae bacterium]